MLEILIITSRRDSFASETPYSIFAGEVLEEEENKNSKIVIRGRRAYLIYEKTFGRINGDFPTKFSFFSSLSPLETLSRDYENEIKVSREQLSFSRWWTAALRLS